jgi:type IV/VI secretion system ImpK/VasF family protein
VEAQSLARVAGDFIASVLLVAEAPSGHFVDPAALRAQLVRQLSALEKHPVAQALDSQEVDDARFALVAWADEKLLRASWSGQTEWAQELLQVSLYRTNRAGDEFYQRLTRLRPDQHAARLVFFLCFVFGFEGQLVGEESQRRVVIQQNYDMLRAAGQVQDMMTLGESQISPAAYELAIQLEPPPSGTVVRILLRWGGGAAVLFGLLWAILRFMAGTVSLPPGA